MPLENVRVIRPRFATPRITPLRTPWRRHVSPIWLPKLAVTDSSGITLRHARLDAKRQTQPPAMSAVQSRE